MKKAIYKIYNDINDKVYIGQSVNPEKRFKAHISRAKNDSDNSLIHKAICKYGKEHFFLEVIEWTEDYNKREQELIQKYNSISPNGYNILIGGEEPPHKFGEEHHNCKVSENDVDIVIYHLKQNILTEPEIALLFNPPLTQSLIHNINFGVTHRRNNETYPIRTQCPYNLTKESVDDIIWLLQNTQYPCWQIADYYQVNTSTIKHINSGRNYHNDKLIYPLRKEKGRKQLEPVETILANRSTLTIDT